MSRRKRVTCLDCGIRRHDPRAERCKACWRFLRSLK